MVDRRRTPRYAVIWREGQGTLRAGRLELTADVLRIEGSSRDGSFSRCEVPLTAIRAVRIGRMRNERVEGMPSLIVERVYGEPLLVADATGTGAVHELADALTLGLQSTHPA